MILRAEQIAQRLETGRDDPNHHDPLVITPVPDLSDLRKSGAASVDLRLGSWFLNLRQARMSRLEVKDADGDSAQGRGKQPQSQLTKMHYVPFGASYFLHPRHFVLGITLEWLRLPRELAAYVIGRSSWGRRGLIIATATGVHPGFRGCLTLELTNVGEIPIAIKPGMAICQLCFHTAETSGAEDVDRSQYVGMRQPRLGKVELDDVARDLARAYSV